ncbi:hypothetical protein NPX13_g694 [Xylaria arbuscula]|uniref:Peptidase S8/S53 domain-containing protein n=1 Tax=Xylaria arbuscula TaxID=114810 RepID=A0A9W8TRS2_9PEZI|nr:hypothetical protein NPX13_g694 [Xylaria arbuscula]
MAPPMTPDTQQTPAAAKKFGDKPTGKRKEPDLKIDDVLKFVEETFASKQEANWSKLPRHVRDFIKPQQQYPKRAVRGREIDDRKRNVLHELAARTGGLSDALVSFTKWLVTTKPYSNLLLTSVEDYDNTPFHRALQLKNEEFVGIVLDSCPPATLTNILKPEDSNLNSQNCVHLAIEKGCRFTQRIIDKCSVDVPEIFQQGDKEGTKNTPLHLAVMQLVPQDELENQERIVRCLITANRETLLKENGKHDVPYQARIRKLGEQEELSFDDDIDQKKDYTAAYHTSGNLEATELSAVESIDDSQSEIEVYHSEFSEEDEEGTYDDESEGDEEEEEDEDEDAYELIVTSSKDALAEDDEYLTREDNSDFRKKVIHDPILKIIRSFSIREFERSDVATALYHQAQERETYFNLSGRSDLTITTAYLEKLARHLKFENVLSYVALPKLTVLEPGSIDPAGPTHPGSKGRRDMGTIFQWLRDKQVETIHAVTVIDSTEPSHSDAAIEEALTDFSVEVWDWKKLDLNCDVIASCTKGAVRDISLYSSGNYAVLMGWASTDGLRCLEKFPKGLEDEARLEQYIDTFATKLRRHQNKEGEYIEVTATKDDKKNSYMDGFRVRHGARSTSQWGNRWMDSMTQFLQVIFNIPMKEAGYVKIAVIDNGVDASLDALDGKIAAGASFCPIPNTSYHNPYYMTSETISHGSMVAGLICRMCPKAKLYVARIDELPSSQGKLLLTAESAAKAIDWAVKKKVDVICMSWTIEPNDGQNDAGISQLRTAISRAETNGITMLCSASDQGGDAKASLPTSTQKCICIGAGTENGDKCSWVHGDDYDYCFPGENVPLKTGRDGLVKMYSGSSVATAIAAGSVGLLLYLNKLIAREAGEGEMKGVNNLGRREQITRALNTMSASSKSTNSRCPRFGNAFGDQFNEFEFQLNRDRFFSTLGQIMDGLKLYTEVHMRNSVLVFTYVQQSFNDATLVDAAY